MRKRSASGTDLHDQILGRGTGRYGNTLQNRVLDQEMLAEFGTRHREARSASHMVVAMEDHGHLTRSLLAIERAGGEARPQDEALHLRRQLSLAN